LEGFKSADAIMKHLLLVLLIGAVAGCGQRSQAEKASAAGRAEAESDKRIRLIIDTDANNELDDQHALAYALSNRDVFDIEGVTVNNTKYGNGLEGHYQEALRVMNLYNAYPEIPLIRGASGNYSDIRNNLQASAYDGKEAVDFIIERAKASDERPLVLVPVGKLTNIALALEKAPEIADKVRIVWLGSNYPKPGEYNLENDTTAVNPVIAAGAPFEMVLVRYEEPSGTAAVAVTREIIKEKMPGKGVKAAAPVIGRHGGTFTTFGDYAVNLFEHAEMHGTPPARALFDMAAIAVIKNPDWADKVAIPAPRLSGASWVSSPDSTRTIWIWENFKKEEILKDFFESIENPVVSQE
jgi:purine nucleosidase